LLTSHLHFQFFCWRSYTNHWYLILLIVDLAIQFVPWFNLFGFQLLT
jgi:hypothetical protein